MSRDTDLATVTRSVRELTQPWTHTQRILQRAGKRQITRLHRVPCPSLLTQLRAALLPGSGAEPGGAAGAPMPVAAGALHALITIEAGARRECRHLSLRSGPSTATALRALLAAATSLTVPDLARVADATRTWHRLARVETGWDDRPRALRDACPRCGTKTLRVHLDASAAWCGTCGASWDAATVGVLAAMLTSTGT